LAEGLLCDFKSMLWLSSPFRRLLSCLIAGIGDLLGGGEDATFCRLP
jgi:hypothetical protein